MGSHDEYRIRLQTPAPRKLLQALRGASVQPQERELIGRVATTHEGDHVFLYADSREVADIVAGAVSRTLREQSIDGQLTVWRWHPLEERWEDADAPPPAGEQQGEQEVERREATEEAESRALGYDEWEVRISLPTHSQAHELAERLEGEGLKVHRNWRHLIVGVEDEAQGRELAKRIDAEEPGSDAVVEGAGMPAWEVLHPYAVFGGLGV
jgi:hypothetical protein